MRFQGISGLWAALLIGLILLPLGARGQFGTAVDVGIPYRVSAQVYPNVALPGETVRLDVTLALDDPWYTYAFDPGARGPIRTSLEWTDVPAAVAVEGEDWREPAPKQKFDQGFNAQVNYHAGRPTFSRTLLVPADAPAGEHTLAGTIRVQVCNDELCLPPRRNAFSATLLVRAPATGEAVATTAEPTPDEVPSAPPTDEPVPTAAAVVAPTAIATSGEAPASVTRWTTEAEQVASDSLTGLIWKAFLLGLLSLLTPCVFPMIPITISFFTKRAAKTTAGRVGLCTVYSGSIVLGFALLGFGLALLMRFAGFGVERAGTINTLAANPWFNIALAGLFVVFGLSLLGLFEIALPSSWANKLEKARGARSDALGAVMMAMIFVIVSFTCTAPIVGPLIVLTFEGHWLKPFVGLTSYAVGFALPFFVLGLIPSALQSMPRSGDWLHATKVTMGLVEIAAALKFLSNADLVWQWNLISRELLLAAWSAIALVTTVYLLGLVRMAQEHGEATRIGPVRMGFSLLFGTLAFYLAFGLFGGTLDPNLESYLPPRQHAIVAGAGATADAAPGTKKGMIVNDLDTAQALSRETGKPLFIDFTGWTCTNCRLNELRVFPDPEVQQLFEDYVLVALYTDDKVHGERYAAYQLERFGTSALPFYVVVTPEDETVATFGGLIRNKNEFLEFLRYGLQGGA
ncbi:MAG: thioredoxin family protein [Candidatus Sumerlaeia bacterium]|nr:thioredoxin family protein [Candidatus Sumerlaeia bacterium]